jgi:hypothetical protein
MSGQQGHGLKTNGTLDISPEHFYRNGMIAVVEDCITFAFISTGYQTHAGRTWDLSCPVVLCFGEHHLLEDG